MHQQKSLVVGLLAAIGICAAGQEVRYQIDRHTDFSKYRTYRWAETLLAGHANQIMEEQITNAIEAELTQKGLRKTDSSTADLSIRYQAAIGVPTGSTPPNSGSEASPSTNFGGRLALEMYDSTTKKLVWRGTVVKIIDPKAKLDIQQVNVSTAVQKLLSNCPPKKD
jgi:hypothetical protein